MKALKLYRSDLRNIERARIMPARGINWTDAWRGAARWAQANFTAKLPVRKAQAAQARKLLIHDRFKNPLTWARRRIAVLLAFWRTQPRARVVSRIIRELLNPQLTTVYGVR